MEQHPNQGGDLQDTPEPTSATDAEHSESREHVEAGLQPRIYAASVHDFNFGIQHGVWLDADQPPEELLAGIETMLRTSPIAREFGLATDEWEIHGHSGFAGLEVGPDHSLSDVSRLARGLVAHGEAYAHWAASTGLDNAVQLNRFGQAYVGRWESLDAFVDHVLDDLGAPTYIANAPESYRRHLRLDRQALAAELESQLHIARGGDGVYVFDPSE
ncbi:antirestriction protein ArdA [Flindersiella endophytica]